jgi:hypothetical protein
MNGAPATQPAQDVSTRDARTADVAIRFLEAAEAPEADSQGW